MAMGKLLVSDDAASEAVTMLQGNILNIYVFKCNSEQLERFFHC